jgi:hypothetical protein
VLCSPLPAQDAKRSRSALFGLAPFAAFSGQAPAPSTGITHSGGSHDSAPAAAKPIFGAAFTASTPGSLFLSAAKSIINPDGSSASSFLKPLSSLTPAAAAPTGSDASSHADGTSVIAGSADGPEKPAVVPLFASTSTAGAGDTDASKLPPGASVLASAMCKSYLLVNQSWQERGPAHLRVLSIEPSADQPSRRHMLVAYAAGTLRPIAATNLYDNLGVERRGANSLQVSIIDNGRTSIFIFKVRVAARMWSILTAHSSVTVFSRVQMKQSDVDQIHATISSICKPKVVLSAAQLEEERRRNIVAIMSAKKQTSDNADGSSAAAHDANDEGDDDDEEDSNAEEEDAVGGGDVADDEGGCVDDEHGQDDVAVDVHVDDQDTTEDQALADESDPYNDSQQPAAEFEAEHPEAEEQHEVYADESDATAVPQMEDGNAAGAEAEAEDGFTGGEEETAQVDDSEFIEDAVDTGALEDSSSFAEQAEETGEIVASDEQIVAEDVTAEEVGVDGGEEVAVDGEPYESAAAEGNEDEEYGETVGDDAYDAADADAAEGNVDAENEEHAAHDDEQAPVDDDDDGDDGNVDDSGEYADDVEPEGDEGQLENQDFDAGDEGALQEQEEEVSGVDHVEYGDAPVDEQQAAEQAALPTPSSSLSLSSHVPDTSVSISASEPVIASAPTPSVDTGVSLSDAAAGPHNPTSPSSTSLFWRTCMCGLVAHVSPQL